MSAAGDVDTEQISQWRSIVTLVVFVITNVIVLLPFHIPIYLPRLITDGILTVLVVGRIISPSNQDRQTVLPETNHANNAGTSSSVGVTWVRFNFPMNFVTAPLIADLFLLAVHAIGRREVHDGTIGANNIAPFDIMAFFITLAYIAISLDASGLIRYLAFKVLQKGGRVGPKLYFYLYAFFFALGSFIGNDPIILSGTAFLAYMTRVSSNIIHPRAWIHTQFAIANIASAILVSSNPTNLVLAGAFKISFVTYTANMVVPVVATAILFFPFLLYIIFNDESLIPQSITMHELSEEAKAKKPVNPNIPNARGATDGKLGIIPTGETERGERGTEEDERNLLPLEEIMNPFLDKRGAAFGAVLMAVTLVTLLVLNAVDQRNGGQPHPVFWVTLPAATVMFLWDLFFDWTNRHETRDIARRGREELQRAKAEHARLLAERERGGVVIWQGFEDTALGSYSSHTTPTGSTNALGLAFTSSAAAPVPGGNASEVRLSSEPDDRLGMVLGGLSSHTALPAPTPAVLSQSFKSPASVAYRVGKDGDSGDRGHKLCQSPQESLKPDNTKNGPISPEEWEMSSSGAMSPSKEEEPNSTNHSDQKEASSTKPGLTISEISKAEFDRHEARSSDWRMALEKGYHDSDDYRSLHPQVTLVYLVVKSYRWLQETFPTVMAVVAHLPFALIPFALSMFVLVQALVTKGWVQVFADGWDHWVQKTGTVGAIGGMGFLSVVLCNFAGTNIGTTILLSRVVQAWVDIHSQNGVPPISNRTFWATVYAMALGVNYGAFGAAFSASLAGLLWRDILARKHIRVRSLDFARVNLPMIAIAMAIGCSILVGEVYIVRSDAPYEPR